MEVWKHILIIAMETNIYWEDAAAWRVQRGRTAWCHHCVWWWRSDGSAGSQLNLRKDAASALRNDAPQSQYSQPSDIPAAGTWKYKHFLLSPACLILCSDNRRLSTRHLSLRRNHIKTRPNNTANAAAGTTANQSAARDPDGAYKSPQTVFTHTPLLSSAITTSTGRWNLPKRQRLLHSVTSVWLFSLSGNRQSGEGFQDLDTPIGLLQLMETASLSGTRNLRYNQVLVFAQTKAPFITRQRIVSRIKLNSKLQLTCCNEVYSISTVVDRVHAFMHWIHLSISVFFFKVCKH